MTWSSNSLQNEIVHTLHIYRASCNTVYGQLLTLMSLIDMHPEFTKKNMFEKGLH